MCESQPSVSTPPCTTAYSPPPQPLPPPTPPSCSMFNDHELELLISGLPEIDVADLRKNTEYTGEKGHGACVLAGVCERLQWMGRCPGHRAAPCVGLASGAGPLTCTPPQTHPPTPDQATRLPARWCAGSGTLWTAWTRRTWRCWSSLSRAPARSPWTALPRCRASTDPRSSRSTRPTGTWSGCPQVGGGAVGVVGRLRPAPLTSAGSPTPHHPLLPTAHTCFNQLDILEYATKEQLRERLMMALHEGSEGFGFA